MRVLSDLGNDLGAINDVVFDPATGVIETLAVDDREVPAASLLGVGSFAAIVRAPAE
jgi:sporulation protein YlmC with PRC-barrel domain